MLGLGKRAEQFFAHYVDSPFYDIFRTAHAARLLPATRAKELFPKKPFIERDAVLPQQRDKFFFEAHPAVVLLLLLNIGGDLLLV